MMSHNCGFTAATITLLASPFLGPAFVPGQRHCPFGRGIRPVLPPGVLKQQLMLVRRLSQQGFNRAEICGVELWPKLVFRQQLHTIWLIRAAQKAIDGFHSHSGTCGD